MENKERLVIPATQEDAITEAVINEARQLCSGVFWVITDDSDISTYKLLMFEIPCDLQGNAIGGHQIPLNSKSGGTYNHKKLWNEEIKNKTIHRPYGKKEYDYYPRGRVEIANDRAIIYLNPNINSTKIVNDIKLRFGLSRHNISNVRVSTDNSEHYKCFIDRLHR